MDEFLRQARALLPWLPESLIRIYADSFAETQNRDIAIAEVRKSPEYNAVYPGNIRDDGTVRLSEQDYSAVKESYGLTLEDYGLNTEYFSNTFTKLIEAGVSPNEFRARIESARSGIVENVPAVKEYYSQNFGLDLNDNQIFASIIDPDVGQAILEGRITQAQIGGEAQAWGFQLSRDEAQALERAGLSQAQARQLFTTAQTELPRLQELQARGGVEQPEEFTLEQFTQAAVFQSPEELEQIRLLEAEEASRFAPVGGLARRGRRVTGLVEE